MPKHPLLLGLTLLSASLFTGQAFADRTVTDQLGRQVTLPNHVTRVVVLQLRRSTCWCNCMPLRISSAS